MCWVFDKLFDLLITVLARIYRWVISPMIHTLAGPGFGCRFEPSCGEYAREALQQHGLLRGLWLAVTRVSRCHPFSGRSGHDPVPSSRITRPACTCHKAVLTEDHPRG